MATAPRRQPRATVNETLRDRGVAHAVYLERLKNTEAQKIRDVFATEVVPDLIDRLTSRLARIEARGIDIDPAGTRRLADMLSMMQTTLDAWSTGLAADLSETVVAIGADEIRWQDSLITTAMPVAWDTLIPATAMIRAAILDNPIDGTLLKDIVSRLGEGAKANVEKAVRIGIAEGESIEKITNRIRKATDLVESSCEAVARTAVGHASNSARSAYYIENGDLIKGVQWHATLDTRTCQSCGALDGKLFPIDSGARPPRHINCRCTSVPVLRSMRELGFDIADFAETTRASMNGQVPASTTFADWIKRMPAEMQDETLGKTRGALLRTGKIEVKDFVNDQGELITLDDLRKREKAAFAAVDA